MLCIGWWARHLRRQRLENKEKRSAWEPLSRAATLRGQCRVGSSSPHASPSRQSWRGGPSKAVCARARPFASRASLLVCVRHRIDRRGSIRSTRRKTRGSACHTQYSTASVARLDSRRPRSRDGPPMSSLVSVWGLWADVSSRQDIERQCSASTLHGTLPQTVVIVQFCPLRQSLVDASAGCSDSQLCMHVEGGCKELMRQSRGGRLEGIQSIMDVRVGKSIEGTEPQSSRYTNQDEMDKLCVFVFIRITWCLHCLPKIALVAHHIIKSWIAVSPTTMNVQPEHQLRSEVELRQEGASAGRAAPGTVCGRAKGSHPCLATLGVHSALERRA